MVLFRSLADDQSKMFATPESLREEHEEIFVSLRDLCKLNTQTGNSIKGLLKVLDPHFRKEEELVMPVLGTLPELVTIVSLLITGLLIGAVWMIWFRLTGEPGRWWKEKEEVSA